jgi:hypothetical protein
MLARLCKLAALLLDFVEQADVLDRDHRLGSEGLQERDLLVRERANRLPPDENRTETATLGEQRRHDEGPEANDFGGAPAVLRHIGVAEGVGVLNGPARADNGSGSRPRDRVWEVLPSQLLCTREFAVRSRMNQPIRSDQVEADPARGEDPFATFDDLLEDGLGL